MWQSLRTMTDYKPPQRLHLFLTSQHIQSTEDAIAHILHTALSHLDKKGSYVRLLFDYNSVFNTIVPSTSCSQCKRVLDFLTGRPQVVRVDGHILSILILISLELHRAVFLAPCCTHCIHMTVLSLSAQTPSSSLLMAQLWWA